MGHELDGDISPIECGLDALISKKGAFLGSEALAALRPTARRTLVTVIFEDEDAVPLGHEPIYAKDQVIGQTTSAAFGFRIGRPVALAHVTADDADGLAVEVAVTGRRWPARLQHAPAFDPDGLRMKADLTGQGLASA